MKRILPVVVAAAASLLSPAGARAAGPWTYAVTGPGGSSVIGRDQIGQVLYFELDATVPDYVWGNVRVDFDTKLLEVVSVEETTAETGFWTAWATQPADPAYGGGGILYYYDQNGLGSDWAAAWVGLYGQGVAGPVAAYDNAAGVIRFYTFTYAGGLSGSVPLRIGFRVKKAGTAVFTTSANDWTAFGWPAAATAGATAATAEVQAAETTAGEGYSWRLEDLPYRLVSEVVIEAPVRTVTIDIRASVGCTRVPGTLSVAVFGEPDLDVASIDVASVTLAGMPVKTARRSGRFLASYEDANGDGLVDLVLVFTNTAGLSGSTPALLEGALADGTRIEGSDAICGP